MAIEIVLYEDNPVLRKSLIELISTEPELHILFDKHSCENAVSEITELKPDLILMDIDLPTVTGIEGVRNIRKINREVTIVMLTVFEDQQKIISSFEAGADGYVLKKNCADNLIPYIMDAMNGGTPMSPQVAKNLVHSFHKSSTNDYELSKRELEILQGLCNGLSYKMIASEANVSFETIRSYMKTLYSKLDVHSATEAVSKALKENIV